MANAKPVHSTPKPQVKPAVKRDVHAEDASTNNVQDVPVDEAVSVKNTDGTITLPDGTIRRDW